MIASTAKHDLDQHNFSCDECDWKGRGDALSTVTDVFERVLPGELMPAGECPCCGCLIPVPDESVPNYTLDVCAGIRAKSREDISPITGPEVAVFVTGGRVEEVRSTLKNQKVTIIDHDVDEHPERNEANLPPMHVVY